MIFIKAMMYNSLYASWVAYYVTNIYNVKPHFFLPGSNLYTKLRA